MRRGDEKPCSGSWHCAHELSRDLLTAGSKKSRRPSSTIGSLLPFAVASRTPVPRTPSPPAIVTTAPANTAELLALGIERLRSNDDSATPVPATIETTLSIARNAEVASACTQVQSPDHSHDGRFQMIETSPSSAAPAAERCPLDERFSRSPGRLCTRRATIPGAAPSPAGTGGTMR